MVVVKLQRSSIMLLALLLLSCCRAQPQQQYVSVTQEKLFETQQGVVAKSQVEQPQAARSLFKIGETLDVSNKSHGEISKIEENIANRVSPPTTRSLQESTGHGSITQIGEEIIGQVDDYFGMSAALSYDGSVFVVGAPGKYNGADNSDTGYTKVYRRDETSSWVQLGQTIHGHRTEDRSGRVVAISKNGNIIAIGSRFNEVAGSRNAGQVNVFELQGSQWVQLGQNDSLVGTQKGERFGDSLALSDDGLTIAVGSHKYDHGTDSDIGKVTVFKWSSNNWVSVGQPIIGEAAQDESGKSVALSGNGEIIVIGAHLNDPTPNSQTSGHVRVYKRNAANFMQGWDQVGLDIDGEAGLDQSGSSVSCSSDGNIILIGAIKAKIGSGDGVGGVAGHARAYIRDETATIGWSRLGPDIDGDAHGDQAGIALSMSADGRIVIIGSKLNDDTGTNAGHAKVFAYDQCEKKWSQIGEDIAGEAQGDQAGYDSSISGDGKTVVVGAHRNDSGGENSGHVRIYNVLSIPLSEISEIPQHGVEILGDGKKDYFGISTASSWDGTSFIVGAPGKSNGVLGVGYSKVYEMKSDPVTGIYWSQKGMTINGDVSGDRAGKVVTMNKDGNIIAIGSKKDHQNDIVGQVKVHEFFAGQWNQLGQNDELVGNQFGEEFGGSIALSEDGYTIAVGSFLHDEGNNQNDIGCVKIYNWSQGVWVPKGQRIVGEASGDQSGFSVDLSWNGEIVVIGAIYNTPNGDLGNAGHVRVYKRDSLSSIGWVQVGSDIDGEIPGDLSGFSVACSSDGMTILIGATKNDGVNFNSGHGRVFVRDENNSIGWKQKGFDIDGEYKKDQSGVAVSISSDGNIVAIGAKFNDDGGNKAGHARVFAYEPNEGIWVKIGCDIDGDDVGDQAGYDTSLSGDGKTLIVGARLDDGNKKDSGSVKVFYLGSVFPELFSGGAGGDPHFKTFEKRYFSYHGECDLVLMECSDFMSGLGISIHIRTTRVNNLRVAYSYISGAALRIGSSVLEVLSNGKLALDGKVLARSNDLTTSNEEVFSANFPSFFSVRKEVRGAHNKIIQYHLTFAGSRNSIRIRSNLKSNMIFVDVDGHFPKSTGLLGGSEIEAKGALARDGVTDLTGQWNSYGEEWQVNDSDPKLFMESRHPQYPAGCVYEIQKSQQIRRGRRRLLAEDSIKKMTFEFALSACYKSPVGKKRDFCVSDVMATGDEDLANDPFYI